MDLNLIVEDLIECLNKEEKTEELKNTFADILKKHLREDYERLLKPLK